MMFRIHFMPKGAYWCIQFSTFGILWDTVQEEKPATDGPYSEFAVMRFQHRDDAIKAVTEMGIADAYDMRQSRGLLSAINAGLANPQEDYKPPLGEAHTDIVRGKVVLTHSSMNR